MPKLSTRTLLTAALMVACATPCVAAQINYTTTMDSYGDYRNSGGGSYRNNYQNYQLQRGQQLTEQFQQKLQNNRAQAQFVPPQVNYGTDPRQAMVQRLQAQRDARVASGSLSDRAMQVRMINNQSGVQAAVAETANQVVLPATSVASTAEQQQILNELAVESSVQAANTAR